MNQNSIQDLELLAKSVLHAVNQGTMTFADAHTALAEKGFNIEADIAIIEDIGKDIEALAEVAKSFIVFLHDILPSNKTKATLSDGEVITNRYCDTKDDFQRRIAKDEEHIKQYGNSGD
jgi:hypothetical protein